MPHLHPITSLSYKSSSLFRRLLHSYQWGWVAVWAFVWGLILHPFLHQLHHDHHHHHGFNRVFLSWKSEQSGFFQKRAPASHHEHHFHHQKHRNEITHSHYDRHFWIHFWSSLWQRLSQGFTGGSDHKGHKSHGKPDLPLDFSHGEGVLAHLQVSLASPIPIPIFFFAIPELAYPKIPSSQVAISATATHPKHPRAPPSSLLQHS